MKRLLKQNLNFLFIILAFFILILGGLACDESPKQGEGILIGIDNNSTVAVRARFCGPDDCSQSIIAPGNKINRTFSKSGGTYVVVVKPMGDWLSFAQAKRDRLVSALAQARESGKIDDISAIAEELRAVTDHIATIIQASAQRSASGPIEGGLVRTYIVGNGELENSITLHLDTSP